MSVEDALAEYKDLLTFEHGLHPDKGEVTLVRFKTFQPGSKGKELWNAVNDILKGLGGEWVSAGKQSHWRVPCAPQKPSESYMSIRCPYCSKVINFKVGGA